MDDDLSCCTGCIIVIFIIFAGFSVMDTISNWHWNHYDVEEVSFENYTTKVVNKSIINSDGGLYPEYEYFVSFDLRNVSTEFIGSNVIFYFYDGDTLLKTDGGTSNNTSEKIDNIIFDENQTHISTEFNQNYFKNVTHVVINIIKDHSILFNKKMPFNMNNYESNVMTEEELHSYIQSIQDSSDEDDYLSYDDEDTEDISIEDSPTPTITYVASANSDVYHEPSCTYAKKIKDANRITFSSKEEAQNAGYSPCAYCNP